MLLPSLVALAGLGLLGVLGYTALRAATANPARVSGKDQALRSVPGSGTSLWAVGNGGIILHSGDGQHWSQQISGTNQTIRSVFGSRDGKSLWAVGDGGLILYSGDGQHWSQQTSGTNQTLLSVFGSLGDPKTMEHGDFGKVQEERKDRSR